MLASSGEVCGVTLWHCYLFIKYPITFSLSFLISRITKMIQKTKVSSILYSHILFMPAVG